jgi:glutamine amidotransferase
MCRHLAYLGPPIPLAGPVLDAPHSLAHQAWAPRDMRGGTVNADGYGVGWLADDGPALLRRTGPIFSDADLPVTANAVRAGALLAAVRAATPGMAASAACCAPFTGDGWLFSHNGVITGWPGSMARLASAALPAEDLLALPAPTDSALLWALLRARLAAGEPPADAVAGLVADVAAAAPGSRLNLLLTDGRHLVGTAVGHSLWAREAAGSVALASEPWDTDQRWRPVGEGTLALADTGSGIAETALAVPAAADAAPGGGTAR